MDSTVPSVSIGRLDTKGRASAIGGQILLGAYCSILYLPWLFVLLHYALYDKASSKANAGSAKGIATTFGSVVVAMQDAGYNIARFIRRNAEDLREAAARLVTLNVLAIAISCPSRPLAVAGAYT